MKNSEFNTYMNMPSVPAGVILDRIVRQQGRTKTEVGSAAQLIPQRLNDLIMGHRRFTPQNSIALENALGIEFTGFSIYCKPTMISIWKNKWLLKRILLIYRSLPKQLSGMLI